MSGTTQSTMTGEAAEAATMPDPLTTGWLAEFLGGRLEGPDHLALTGISGVDQAAKGEITFISNRRYARRWADSQATAAIVSEGVQLTGHDEGARAVIHVPDAEIASIEVLRLFAPPEPRPEPGVHPTAWVADEVSLGPGVRVGPHVSIDRGAVIGEGVVIHAGCRIYPEARIGAGSTLHANVVVRERCTLGRGVICHAGVVIGADGFGYRPDPSGNGLLKVPHIGTVEIGDGVEIGANTCIDRGKFGPTTIGAGTKIDNLVQVGHNVQIGRSCVVAGLAGFSGSVVLGDGVQIGGAVGVADHVHIGDGVQVAGRSGVMRDVEPGKRVGHGLPAEDAGVALRQLVAIRKLPDLISKLSHLAEQK